MNHLSSTLVLCDLDHLLLGADGNRTPVVLVFEPGGNANGMCPTIDRRRPAGKG